MIACIRLLIRVFETATLCSFLLAVVMFVSTHNRANAGFCVNWCTAAACTAATPPLCAAGAGTCPTGFPRVVVVACV